MTLRRRWLAAMLGMTMTLALPLAGCASKKKTVYLNPTANFAAVQRVAILPLQNFTNDVHAPEKVAQILTIELLRAQAFDLTDPGEVREAMAVAQIEQVVDLSHDQQKALGDALDAQALFMGTVQDLSLDRSSGVNTPTISLHFQMVDTATGETIWSALVSRQGAGASARLFGIGGESINEALRDMVREALRSLIR